MLQTSRPRPADALTPLESAQRSHISAIPVMFEGVLQHIFSGGDCDPENETELKPATLRMRQNVSLDYH